MVTAPVSGVSMLTGVEASGAVALHLAVSRSAAVRLWPVAAALAATGAPQALVDLDGERRIEPGLPPELPIPGASPDAAVEAAIERTRPACVLVAGDGDAVVDAALAASRCDVPIVRLGAGQRSGDRSTREEVNRLVLDELAELLLTDGDGAAARLRGEGAEDRRIRLVGSTVADVTRRWRTDALRRATHSALGVDARRYLLVALAGLEQPQLLDALLGLAERMQVVVCAAEPLDLAARARLRAGGIVVAQELDYVGFLALEAAAGAVLTDSGRVQEEATVLGVQCFTFAHRSERALTLTHGTNVVIGDDPADLAALAFGPLATAPEPIPLWGGDAGRRVAAELLAWSRA